MNVIDRLQNIYKNLDKRTGGVLRILKSTVESFGKARGSQAAAAVSYYALFSLFPLLLVLVAAGSYFLEGDPVQSVMNLVAEAIPLSRELIERNLEQVLNSRGAVGLIGLLTLLWSASGVFGVLATNINLAWPDAEKRSFIMQRSLAIGIVVILLCLLVVAVVGSTIMNILSEFQVPVPGTVQIYGTFIWGLLSNFLAWFFSLLALLAIYRWLPNTEVNWRAAFWGALFSATTWEIATSAFVWYLGSGLNRYKLVYGSLGAVIALLFIIYISSLIILFGAHLSSAVQRSQVDDDS